MADPRPSVHSTDRLRDAVRGDTRDLRVGLTEALDLAARLEATGRTDLAIAVLEEQRDLLADVHARLEQRLAGAMVEHEAEVTLRGVDAAPGDAGREESPVAVLGPAPSTLGRLLASAVAAVVGAVLLLLPDAPVGTVGIAGTVQDDVLLPADHQPPADDLPDGIPGGLVE